MTTTHKTRKLRSARVETGIGAHDHRILLLQGGGALGAYHGGVYEGLAATGFAPDWVVGISIGAINSALIVGNPPERRIERLREFWNLVSEQSPFVLPADTRLRASDDEPDGRRLGDGLRHPRVLLAAGCPRRSSPRKERWPH